MGAILGKFYFCTPKWKYFVTTKSNSLISDTRANGQKARKVELASCEQAGKINDASDAAVDRAVHHAFTHATRRHV